MQTISRQRDYILSMEETIRQYQAKHQQLQVIQNSLIGGRVNLARQVLSDVLLKWPSK